MSRFDEVVNRIKERYPQPRIEIEFNNPFELLVGLVLSARCTDSLTNKITKELFKRFPDAESMSKASVEEINELISSCSMHNTKAKNLKKIAEILCKKHNCEVPDRFEELVKLPGVADKTANMVLSFGFGIPAVGVDTHVRRVAKRLGISKSDRVKDVEEDIKRICPKDEWIRFYSGLILLGRYICKAKKPDCENCFLKDICPKIGIVEDKSSDSKTSGL